MNNHQAVPALILVFLIMSVLPAYALPEILSQIFKKKEPVEETTPTAAESPREGSNIEEVLKTLDEALKENRKLRQQVTGMEEDIKRAPGESNLLKSQIRSLQHELLESRQRNESDRKALNGRLAELKNKDAELSQQAAGMEQLRKRTGQRSKKLRRDIERFRRLLKNTILTEERDEYRSLIQRAEEQSNRAVKELSEVELNHEIMQRELANAYYDLGNKFFESKNYKEALTQYEKAIVLNPSDAWAHHNLGVIYDYYIQNKEAALSHYQQYLQIKPAAEEAREIRTRVMDLKLGSLLIPSTPTQKDFKENTRKVDLRETNNRRWT